MDLVAELINFLEPFEEMSVKLKMRNRPSIQYMCLAYEKLISHCRTREALLGESEDSEVVRAMRAKCLRLFLQKFELKMKHKLAYFVWPFMKDMHLFRMPSDKQEVRFLDSKLEGLPFIEYLAEADDCSLIFRSMMRPEGGCRRPPAPLPGALADQPSTSTAPPPSGAAAPSTVNGPPRRKRARTKKSDADLFSHLMTQANASEV